MEVRYALLLACLLAGLYTATDALPMQNDALKEKDETTAEIGSKSDPGQSDKDSLTKELKNRKTALEHLLEETDKQLNALEETEAPPATADGDPSGHGDDGIHGDDDNHLQRDSRYIVGQPIMPGRDRSKKLKGKRLLGEAGSDSAGDREVLERILSKLNFGQRGDPKAPPSAETAAEENAASLEQLSQRLSGQHKEAWPDYGATKSGGGGSLVDHLQKIEYLLSRLETSLDVM